MDNDKILLEKKRIYTRNYTKKALSKYKSAIEHKDPPKALESHKLMAIW